MGFPTTARNTPLRIALSDIIVPATERLLAHPYYRGLLDGSLPGAALATLCLQDANHLLPSYAKALAHCAGSAWTTEQADLLAEMAKVSFDSAAASMVGFPALARRYDLPGSGTGVPPIEPATSDYAEFLLACSSRSLAAGIGAVAPSAWLYQLVTDELMARRDPAGRYGDLLAMMYPGKAFAVLVEQFLMLIERVYALSSAPERDELLANVGRGVGYEGAFVDAAWRAGR